MLKLKFKFQHLLLILCIFPVLAKADIVVSQSFARETFPGAPSAAVYLSIKNTSGQAVVLERIEVDGNLAGKALLHNTTMQGDMMKMRHHKGDLTIEAGGSVTMISGGMHIMLMDLKRALKKGDSIRLTLFFRNGIAQTVTVPVLSMEDSHHHH